ncbi:hypothetical protein BJY52DRAFT_447022 [Lactarius psammicola]|nr:hypothetical protein BJY52DRAFT_447022 [Lactarius psammicola]
MLSPRCFPFPSSCRNSVTMLPCCVVLLIDTVATMYVRERLFNAPLVYGTNVASCLLFMFDSMYNGTPALTPLSFYCINASSVSLFYGSAPWHFYLFQTLPLLAAFRPARRLSSLHPSHASSQATFLYRDTDRGGVLRMAVPAPTGTSNAHSCGVLSPHSPHGPRHWASNGPTRYSRAVLWACPLRCGLALAGTGLSTF